MVLVNLRWFLCLGATSEEKEDGGEEMAIFDESDCVSKYKLNKLTAHFHPSTA